MDFSWSDEQLAFKDKVIQFARSSLHDDLPSRERSGTFPQAHWRACADFGIQGLAMPEQYGGSDVDILTALIAMEALGYGCRDNGLTFALNAQMWTVQLPILHFGTDEQKSRYLPALCDGTMIGAHAITESESGSDVFSLKTRADRQGDGYLLNGEKKYVTLGPVADFALIFASTTPDKGRWGLSAFLVETDRPGLVVSPVQDKMGLRTSPIGNLSLEDCAVPAENRLGTEGAGTGISNNSLEWERCCILASNIGAMEHQVEKAIEYARRREQFGQPIGKFQSVSNRIVDMKMHLETARLLLYKTAWLKKEGRPAMMEAAMAKLYLSEHFVQSSLDAIRVHGGAGYMTENEIERDLRDAVGGVIYGGTSDIQRNIIARLLGL